LRKINGEDGSNNPNVNANDNLNDNHNADGNAGENVGKGTVLRDTGESDDYKPVWQNNDNHNDNANVNDNAGGNDDDDENGTERNYGSILKVIDEYNRLANEEEGKAPSEEERKKIEKANRRRMLIAGIADAANAFHQAFSYANGKNPMTDKSYSEEARKRERDDWEWMNKNRERAMKFRTMAAEWEKALLGIENKAARLKFDIDKASDKSALEWVKVEIDRAHKQGLLSNKEVDLLQKAIQLKINQQNADTAAKRAETGQQNANRQGLKKVHHIERDKYDNIVKEWYEYVHDDEPADEQPASNSSAGQSKGYGYDKNNSGKKSKGTGYDR
jgi:hypothetical protein